MSSRSRRARPGMWLATVVAVLLLSRAPAHAGPATPTAGTVITSQATATYVDGATGRSFSLDSNVVQAIVQATESFTLTASQEVRYPRGSTVVLSHHLVNTGNVASDYRVSAQNLAGDSGDLIGLNVYLDANGNGVKDPTDPQITTLHLEPGQQADLLVVGIVPPTLTTGQSVQAELDVTAAASAQSAANTDTVDVLEGPVMSVVKSASLPTMKASGQVSFTITATNIGSSPAVGRSVVVDGSPASLVVLRDPVPNNTSYVSATGSGGGRLLFHKSGDPIDTYQSTAPTPTSAVDAVAYAVASMAPGQGVTLTQQVQAFSYAGGNVQNTAEIRFQHPTLGTDLSTLSNTVTVTVPQNNPTIQYYTDTSYAKPTSTGEIGRPLYVQVVWAAGNKDPQQVDHIKVLLMSKLTGDHEEFTAVETGPNTGIFRIEPPVPTADGTAGFTANDGILQTVQNDTIIAQEQSSGFAVSTDMLIDPFGVIFDSHTNATVPGASVTLIDVTGAGNGSHPNAPATVFQVDGTTPAPSTVVTGADGIFRFPLVAPSTYRLAVAPPAPDTFPSQVAPGQLPAGRAIDPQGSYGGTFVVSGFNAVHVDVPVDGAPPGGLFVDKSVNTDQVELGDFLIYTVKVADAGTINFTATTLSDTLPVGFAYVPGSARVNNAPMPDPAGGRGPRLTFTLGALSPGQTDTVTYRVKVGPGTSLGNEENRAFATGNFLLGSVTSNTSGATVRVLPGVFSDRGVVFGKVYLDLNGNHVQDAGEPGVPGVRLYLEDGSSVITDEEGKYSLYGLLARTHVMRVDRATLPPGARMEPLNNRNAGGTSSFVDIKRDELMRSDFAIDGDSAQVRAEVAARRKAARGPSSDAGRELAAPINPDASQRDLGDVKARPADGVLGPESLPPPNQGAPPRTKLLNSRNSNLPPKPVRAVPQVSLKAEMDHMDNHPGFVDFHDGDVLPLAQTPVRVKGMAGTTLRLTVNGLEVPEKKVGRRSQLPSRQLELWEYYGVNLKPGDNTLRLDQVDPFGNVRGTVTVQVKAPGAAAHLKLILPEKDPQADGKTPIPVVVEITDGNGLPVTARTPVTLQSQLGHWDAKDLDPSEPGVQVFVTGGRGEFHLIPGTEPGDGKVEATSGELEADGQLRLIAALRPMFITGVVEGTVDFRHVSTGDTSPTRIDSLLETEMDRLASADHARSRMAGRVAVFGKGSINKDTMLTFRYDSNQTKNTPLFRDIQPLDFFPIYGDASIKGFEAQSTSPLYLRIDSHHDYLMHGDFLTAPADTDMGLGTYSRSLTGAKGHLETPGLRMNAFATHTRQRQEVEEIPANGTSGPYLLQTQGYVNNSEKVEIITRDRNQPAVVLKVTPMTRFTDYVVDSTLDGIVFRQPIPSLDSNLNPQFVRVVYEADNGGSFYWTYGGDARFRLTRQLMLGASYADEDSPDDPYRLYSAHLSYQVDKSTKIIAEVAHSRRKSLGSGSATRLEMIHNDGRLAARLFVGRSDADFQNPTSILSNGRSETSAKVSYRVDPKTTVRGEYIRTADVTSGGRRVGYDLSAERVLWEGVKVEAGIRHADEGAAPALAGSVGTTPDSLTTARVKISAQVPNTPAAQVFAEYEQDVHSSRKRALALGGSYQVNDRTRIYARHELISSLTGRYGLNNLQNQNATVVGIDTAYTKDGHLFSEYRIRDAISGREAEAAIGLRNIWRLGKGLRASTSFERVFGGNDITGGNTSAVTGGLEYTASRNLKATGRFEFRTGNGAQATLRSLGVAWKVNDDFSLLARDIAETQHATSAGGGGGGRSRDRMLIGLAYRPVNNNKLDGLLKFERRFEGDDPNALPVHAANIVSANLNYQLDPRFVVSGLYAAKWARDTVNGSSAESTAQMYGGRATWDVAKGWDLSVQGARLVSPGGRSDQQSLGMEIGRLLTNELWLSVGYNFNGFSDLDLNGENYTARGFFLRLRLKLGVDDFDDHVRPMGAAARKALTTSAPPAGGKP